MTYKDALELLNMFTTATQIAKARNKYEYRLEMNEDTMLELLKKAFPSLKDNVKLTALAKKILNQ